MPDVTCCCRAMRATTAARQRWRGGAIQCAQQDQGLFRAAAVQVDLDETPNARARRVWFSREDDEREDEPELVGGVAPRMGQSKKGKTGTISRQVPAVFRLASSTGVAVGQRWNALQGREHSARGLPLSIACSSPSPADAARAGTDA
jgi:hypothetical protein